MKRFLSSFWFKAPYVLTYMLQQFEYDPVKFLKWVLRLPDLFTAQKRGKLTLTKRAKLMLIIAYGASLLVIVAAVILAVQLSTPAWLLLAFLAPDAAILSIFLVTYILQKLIIDPAQDREISRATAKLQSTSAQRIAVIGSYGKTTMKELLYAVLAESKNVVVTPGNKNILVSHARWVNKFLDGDEDILVFEYGEGAPGDIQKLASFSQPTFAVITGLAPAHLDAYSTLEAVADDFATISVNVAPENIYVHDQPLLKQKLKGIFYNQRGLPDYKVQNVKIDFTGTSFELVTSDGVLKLKTSLLGSHQLGPLTAVVSVAKRLGLTDDQITAGIATTSPYEHRMQPRHVHGAWIIDDTYNGNIEGMRAGLDLLKVLPAKRRIYVTPGLADQGIENEAVHKELGHLIGNSAPNKVILMQNSNTEHIKVGLEASSYKGELHIEPNPLEYYTNLEHYIAAGDVVMLQNDLPDSYN